MAENNSNTTGTMNAAGAGGEQKVIKGRIRAMNDIYTALLAMAVFALVATSALVFLLSQMQYGTWGILVAKP